MHPNLEEAERRIEEARRTGAESLDLGDLALSELPASLGGLSDLKVLYLGLTSSNGTLCFDRDPFEVTDLSPLAGLKGLQVLDLRECRGVVDLSPLAGLQGLQSLDLTGTGVTDLTSLAGLRELRSLALTRTAVTELAPLAGNQKLCSLDLTRTAVTDLAPLAELQGLRNLELSDTSVTDLAQLAGLESLQSLSLSNTAVTDLSPLAELQELLALDLTCTGVTDLTPLAGAQRLQHLSLAWTGVKDLAPLLGLQLQSLEVWETGVFEELGEQRCLAPLLRGLETIAGFLHAWKEKDIKSLAPFFADEGHGHAPGKALIHQEAPEIEAARRPPAGKKRRKIYISYAWGDDSPEGKIRTNAVERLCSALKEDGFNPVRDRDRIQPGDQISAFMNRLTHADLVVAVVSDQYLRSPNCMYEIYKLWQRVQADSTDLAQCLVPIVLPGVRVGNFKERLPYLKHWAEEAESLEELVRDPRLRPGRQSWEEARLVREFAHHVDDILVFLNDVLMDRRLDVHLDNGFEAVRDALRRRLRERR